MPRVMVDVSSIDTSCMLLGKTPLHLIGCICIKHFHGQVHHDLLGAQGGGWSTQCS
jgi:hypothetical protein